MATITTTGPDSVKLHYTDTGGTGRPLVMVHPWPLSGEIFERNLAAFTGAGNRVITYDRRGFGQSYQPATGYDFDTLTADLGDVITQLDLQDAVILGYSMGGGEVVRYCASFGTDRIAGLVLSGSICPAMCITDDNPDGAMPMSAFEELRQACLDDPTGYLEQSIDAHFTNNHGLAISSHERQLAYNIAFQASNRAAADSILTWATDLREDCRQVDVPALVLHGDQDHSVPLAVSSARAGQYLPNSQLVVVPEGTHCLNITHQEVWENAILEFVARL